VLDDAVWARGACPFRSTESDSDPVLQLLTK
jgi:hypothetical protein